MNHIRHLGKVQAALAFAVAVGFFGTLYLLMTIQDAGGMRDALLIMVGALGAGFATVLNYYFGSSSGSARKDEMQAQREVKP